MKGIVFGSTIERANKKLKEIINNYEKYHIKSVSVIKTEYNMRAGFVNGDYWESTTVSSSSKGYCANIGYIDREIPIELINAMCIPCIKALPWTGVQYFG